MVTVPTAFSPPRQVPPGRGCATTRGKARRFRDQFLRRWRLRSAMPAATAFSASRCIER
jgi:hypothetical protein